MKFKPTTYQIIATLDNLGLKHESHPNHKGWLQCQCPNPTHYEQVHDNCSVNLNSGFIKCFSCGYGNKGESRKSIVNAVMDRLNYSYKEAIQFIEQGIACTTSIMSQQTPKRKRVRKKPLYNFTMVDLNPNDFYYTRSRGFTEEFIKHFNIKHVTSSWFNDYMIIPIIDSSKHINEYEGRKLKEYETLCEFYKVTDIPLDTLKNNFKLLCRKNDVRLNRKNYKVYMGENVIEDSQLQYLLKPKTLYISNSRCQETLWNIDNLNREEDLFVVEGLGSVCCLWSHISKNVTAIFGVSITEEQIEYLKQFKKVIYIPDYDKAGYESVNFLKDKIDNLSVIVCQCEDTDSEYVDTIKNSEQIDPNKYIYDYAPEFRFNINLEH